MRSSRVFDGLNYSFGNEDNVVEYTLLPYRSTSVATVCHSGAQLVGFLSKEPRSICVVDISQEQLLIAQLRLHLLKTLSHDDYLAFWGYPPFDIKEETAFRLVCIENFEYRHLVSPWVTSTDAPLYVGKWERTCYRLSKLYRFILGTENIRQLLACDTLERQQAFLRSHFSHRRWQLLVKTASALAATYGYLRPHELPPDIRPLQFFPEYKRIFAGLLSHSPAATNFFLQIILLGRMTCAATLEANRETYDKAKDWVKHCDVTFVKRDVFEHLIKSQAFYSFVTLSNVPSYLNQERRVSYLQEIQHCLSPGAQVVTRNFLCRSSPCVNGYIDKSEQARAILETERTRVYKISVYERS